MSLRSTAACAGLLLALAAGLSAQDRAVYSGLRPGVRAGFYTTANGLFVGADLVAQVARNIDFNPNVELAFGNESKLIEISADALYNLVPRNRSLLAYLGAGFGVLFRNPDVGPNATDVGLNGIAGVAFRTGGRFLPYLQAKVIISGETDFVLGGGFRF